MIKFLAMRPRLVAASLLLPLILAAADTVAVKKHGKTVGGVERLLYVTNKSGVSVYDINDSHKLLRSFEVPETAEYKGISASWNPAKLSLTSNLTAAFLSTHLP